MNLLNFTIAISGIMIFHFVIGYLYNKISQVFPFVFGGSDSKSDALYKQMMA